MKRLWFWLTTAKVCAWCHTTMHYPWIPIRDRMTRNRLLPRVTHGICEKCARKVIEP